MWLNVMKQIQTNIYCLRSIHTPIKSKDYPANKHSGAIVNAIIKFQNRDISR